MGYIDPKQKVKEGNDNGQTEEIADLLDELGISFDDNKIEKVEKERKADRYEPKL